MFESIITAKNSVCGFIRRHKGLVIVGGLTACAVGSYYGVKRVLNEADRLSVEFQKQLSIQHRLQLQMECTNKECHQAFLRFLPSLRAQLYRLIDVDTPVNQLRQLKKSQRQERNEIWERVKLAVLTRYFAGIYAFSLLHIMVQIQLHLIGRETFNQEKKDKKDTNESANSKVSSDQEGQHEFLSSCMDYLLNTGLPELIQRIQEVLKDSSLVESWSVHKKNAVTRDEVFQLLECIHLDLVIDVSQAANLPQSPAKWRHFIINEDNENRNIESMQHLLNEYWDILESPFFNDVLHESTFYMFTTSWDQFANNSFPSNSLVIDTALDKENNIKKDDLAIPEDHIDDSIEETKSESVKTFALAKILPQLKAELAKIFATSNQDELLCSTYAKNLSQLNYMQDLCHMIYTQRADKQSSEWSLV